MLENGFRWFDSVAWLQGKLFPTNYDLDHNKFKWVSICKERSINEPTGH